MIYLWTELVCGKIKHKSKFCSQVIYTICITVYFEILLEYTVVWDWKFTFHQSEIQMKSNYKSDEILNTKVMLWRKRQNFSKISEAGNSEQWECFSLNLP